MRYMELFSAEYFFTAFELLIDLHQGSKKIRQATVQTTFKENCQTESKKKGKICIPLYFMGSYWHFVLSVAFHDQMNITAVTGCNV